MNWYDIINSVLKVDDIDFKSEFAHFTARVLIHHTSDRIADTIIHDDAFTQNLEVLRNSIEESGDEDKAVNYFMFVMTSMVEMVVDVLHNVEEVLEENPAYREFMKAHHLTMNDFDFNRLRAEALPICVVSAHGKVERALRIAGFMVDVDLPNFTDINTAMQEMQNASVRIDIPETDEFDDDFTIGNI